MRRYIPAKKLIEYIKSRRDGALERQKNLERIGQETVLNEMIAAELNRLISFIDSLQHEQPEVESQKIKAWIAREWGPNGRLRMFNFLPKKCPCGYEWEGNSWVINDIMPNLSYTNSPIEVELTISILNARKEEGK